MTSVFTENIFGAIKAHDSEAVQTLVLNGVDPNFSHSDITPVMFAVKEGSLACLSALLKVGADPDQGNSCSWAPVLEAAKTANIEALKLLMTAGADLDVVSDFGDGVLHAAAASSGAQRERAKATLDFLWEQGYTDAEEKNDKGLTPLEVAIEKGNKQAEEHLVLLASRAPMENGPREEGLDDVKAQDSDEPSNETDSVIQAMSSIRRKRSKL